MKANGSWGIIVKDAWSGRVIGRPYLVKTKGYILSSHKTRMSAQIALRQYRRLYKTAGEAVTALAQRNYRPFSGA